MEFGVKKCSMLVMKSGKGHLTERTELPTEDKIRMLGENETSKYLVILDVNTIEEVKMKDKILKEYLR